MINNFEQMKLKVLKVLLDLYDNNDGDARVGEQLKYLQDVIPDYEHSPRIFSALELEGYLKSKYLESYPDGRFTVVLSDKTIQMHKRGEI